MTGATPRLSVLMTVYNGGRFLAPAVASVLAGDIPDLEFVIVDNVSTDGSRDWLRGIGDSRVRLIENEVNLGQTGALRRGLEACRAPVVARLDADDISEPERFGLQLAFLERHDRVALVGGQTRRIDQHDKPLDRTHLPTDPGEIAAVMALANPFIHSAAAFRREAALKVGGYPAEFAVAQDYALWSALMRAGWQLANLPDIVCRLRLHPGQVTASGLGAKEGPEALAITTLNQAWALGREGSDPNLAAVLQYLWSGAGNPADAPSCKLAAETLLGSPRWSWRGRARLALLMAMAPTAAKLGLRAGLLARALPVLPGEIVRRVAHG